jgi:hypothetical protein
LRALLRLASVLLVSACGRGTHVMTTQAGSGQAELVIRGGTVLTMDPIRPRAEAVAVAGGRIVAVGDARDIDKLVGPATRVVDLAGGTLTPGLVDGHCHLYGLGKALAALDVKGQTSAAAVAALVGAAAKSTPEGEWITGRGWDQNLWSPQAFPSKDLLDAVAPKHPVALRRVDGHAAWVNSLALARAGITAATVDPSGGKIVRDAAGQPTGVLIDNAVDLILNVIPADSEATRERMILAAQDVAVAAGLTGVHEMGIDDTTVSVYRRLAADGRLKLRVYAFLTGEGQIETLPRRTPDRDPDGNAMFVLRAVKLYADGALGSRGAAMLLPYSDDPGNRGLDLMTPEEVGHAAQGAAASGWQLGIHAIGDRANRVVLDAYAPLAGRDLRFRIEHAQIVAPEDLRRFGQLGVVAAMQPTHATSDMAWADERIGEARLGGAYAWRSISAGGAHVVGGSDFPIEDVPPLLGLYAAVTRQDVHGQPAGGWLPGQKLSLDEAVRLFTVEPAWAAFAEQHRGRIIVGQVADFSVLDRELWPDQRLLAVQVVMTIVGGKVVYARGG